MTSDVERLRRLRRLRTWFAVVLVAIPIVMVATGLAARGGMASVGRAGRWWVGQAGFR